MDMQTIIRRSVLALLAVAASTAFTSCYYDPSYYSGSASAASVPTSYGSGYGYGYGYGGSSFSTSFFISTGDPRWGYDPYCYSYYDYHRRCYYDPYLHGYYPVGYRPPVIVGCPHPYGYRRGYCPPPRTVRNVTVVNYRDRVGSYRQSNYGWARQVRQGRPQQFARDTTAGGRVDQYGRGDRGNDRATRNAPTRRESGANRAQQNRTRVETNRGTSRGRIPSGYNTPVSRQQGRSQNAAAPNRDRGRQEIRRGGAPGNPRANQQPNRGAPQREQQRRGNSGEREESRREIRGLGRG